MLGQDINHTSLRLGKTYLLQLLTTYPTWNMLMVRVSSFLPCRPYRGPSPNNMLKLHFLNWLVIWPQLCRHLWYSSAKTIMLGLNYVTIWPQQPSNVNRKKDWVKPNISHWYISHQHKSTRNPRILNQILKKVCKKTGNTCQGQIPTFPSPHRTSNSHKTQDWHVDPSVFHISFSEKTGKAVYIYIIFCCIHIPTYVKVALIKLSHTGISKDFIDMSQSFRRPSSINLRIHSSRTPPRLGVGRREEPFFFGVKRGERFTSKKMTHEELWMYEMLFEWKQLWQMQPFQIWNIGICI